MLPRVFQLESVWREQMCITRVGKVVSVTGGVADVEFVDGRGSGGVDVSVIGGVAKGTYVEVFGNLALSVLTPAEARRRRTAWKEVRKAAMVPEGAGGARV